jgi:pantoate--beta-alanine ligase
MDVITGAAEMRAWSRAQRAHGHTIALVPTMGYLHQGHLSLVAEARRRADRVVASIYVNPTQFAAGEDFGVYPRDLPGDRVKLAALGCDVTFEPVDLYGLYGLHVREGSGAPPHETWVTVERLAQPLCGVSRPTFFRGVATVVTKLFNIVDPDLAVFGNKDYQQARVIERLVRDLDFAIEIVAMPIVREPDGLAMSSRNALLSADERARAVAIRRALLAAQALVDGGERDASALAAAVAETIADAGGRVDYVELRDPATLDAVAAVTGTTLLATAAHFGAVRLIDNVELTL